MEAEEKEHPRSPGGRRESFTEKQMLELSEIWVLGRLVEQTGGERKANAETTGEGEPGVGPVEG